MAKLDFTLKAATREATGKGVNRRKRTAEITPAVLYGPKGLSKTIEVDANELFKAIRDIGGSQLFSLVVDDGEALPCLIWQVQRHPFKRGLILHVDFFAVDMEKPIRVDVPVKLHGTAPGVKLGGILEIFHNKISVECLPMDIPAQLDVDISKLTVGKSVQVKDVALPENVKSYTDTNLTLLGVVAKRGMAASAEEEEGEGEAAEA